MDVAVLPAVRVGLSAVRVGLPALGVGLPRGVGAWLVAVIGHVSLPEDDVVVSGTHRCEDSRVAESNSETGGERWPRVGRVLGEPVSAAGR